MQLSQKRLKSFCLFRYFLVELIDFNMKFGHERRRILPVYHPLLKRVDLVPKSITLEDGLYVVRSSTCHEHHGIKGLEKLTHMIQVGGEGTLTPRRAEQLPCAQGYSSLYLLCRQTCAQFIEVSKLNPGHDEKSSVPYPRYRLCHACRRSRKRRPTWLSQPFSG